MPNVEYSSLYKRIGEELINEMPELAYIRASNVDIEYLVSDQTKKDGLKPVYAETEKIPPKYKWGLAADFTITVFQPAVANFNLEQKKILIFQQLLRVGIDYNVDKNEEKYSLIEPDVVDFAVIVKRYGVNWKETQRELFEDDKEETALDVMRNHSGN